jgi:hypothetical protein
MLMTLLCRRCVHSVGSVGDDVGVNASEFILKWQRRMKGETPMKRGYKETKRYIREVKGNNEKQQKFLQKKIISLALPCPLESGVVCLSFNVRCPLTSVANGHVRVRMHLYS